MGERYYMNKMFGRGMEQARRLDDETPGGDGNGGLQRVTIEPHTHGGHRVIVERETVAEDGQSPRGAAGSDRTEHSFARPADALAFLHDLLTGREPAETADAGEPGGAQEAICP